MNPPSFSSASESTSVNTSPRPNGMWILRKRSISHATLASCAEFGITHLLLQPIGHAPQHIHDLHRLRGLHWLRVLAARPGTQPERPFRIVRIDVHPDCPHSCSRH